MALTYNYTNCDDSKWTKEDHQMAVNFCWTLMHVDIGSVTEKNKNEILFRLMFLQKLDLGAYTKDFTIEEYLDLINKMVGYYTNVQTLTRRKFLSNKMKHVEDRIKRDIEYTIKKREEKNENLQTKAAI